MIQLDHLVVAASTLDQGSRFLEELLGTSLQVGGQHVGFGTHNRLLSLGSDTYLELIAIDPNQTQLQHPIPFGLGSASMQKAIIAQPRLIAWVASTTSIRDALRSHQPKIGQATAMQRGDLHWTIALRSDGQRVPDGLPTLIDWGQTAHPCTRLTDTGIRLRALHINASIDAHSALKLSINDPRIFIQPAKLSSIRAILQTRSGKAVTLSG